MEKRLLDEIMNGEGAAMQLSFRDGGSEVNFTLVYRDRRSIGIRVEPPGVITVFAPRGTPPDFVAAQVRLKAVWLRRQLRLMAEAAPWCAEKQCVDGEMFWLLGETYPLRVITDERYAEPEVRPVGGYLAVLTPAADRELIHAVLRRWYQAEAGVVLKGRVERYRRFLPVAPVAVKVKEQRRQWGSCSADKILRFNWRLVMAPLPVVDYVVVHELCHLMERNHGKAFWAWVEAIMPDWREQRKWLRNNGLKLSF